MPVLKKRVLKAVPVHSGWKGVPSPFTDADAKKVELKIKRNKATGEEMLALFWHNNP